ncbi:MAG: ABC transporter permease [Chitinophagaceae bacterium]|nr:ABC transporter permease [Chitinophagaceae bacterium]
MRTLKYLLQKEYRQIFRNKIILRMIIAMPMIQLIILPLAADYEIKNINIAVVDQDRSSFSRELVNRITAAGYFRLQQYTHSYEEAFPLLESDKADLILEIPSRFEKDLVREGKQSLLLAVNAINGTKAMVGANYLNRIIQDYNTDIKVEWKTPAMGAKMIEIESVNWFNPHMKYAFFMVPGILVLLVTMISAYMCSMNIVREKEIGTIEQINVTPVKKQYFILGKLIPFWTIGMVLFSVGLFVIGRFVYGIVPLGNILALYAYLALFLIAVLGFGLLISTYSNTQQQAMSLAFFFVMIFLLMSGLFTSIDSMPTWARWVAYSNPVSYFIEVVRMVVLKGSGFGELGQLFLVMAGFAVGFNGWAVWNYRKVS